MRRYSVNGSNEDVSYKYLNKKHQKKGKKQEG